MKKIFTLISLMMVSLCVSAETLLDFSQKQDYGITISGTTTISTVKINNNTNSVACIKFANSYTTEEAVNANYAKLTVDGGFKAGDVVTIAGAFNNSDDSKISTIELFTVDGTTPTVLFATKQFINGRTVAESPEAETYTLTADADELYIGRNGNTGTCVTELKIVRGEESTIGEAKDPTPATTWNFTQELSEADAANLAADAATWTFDAESNYWKNTVTLAERSVLVPLKANGVELELTKGITFARDGSEGLDAERVRIAPGKFVAVNGSKISLSFGEMAKDDVIKMIIKGAGDSERTLSPANAEVIEGTLTTADTEQHIAAVKVKKDGTVSFETTNGFQFFAFAINAELPEIVTGIETVKVAHQNANAIYNLAGQQVNEGFKGLVIMNGKKIVKK